MKERFQNFVDSRLGRACNVVISGVVAVLFLFRISLIATAAISSDVPAGIGPINQITDTVLVLASTYISYVHGDIFRLTLTKKQKLDERLLALRRKVYEGSFRFLVMAIFIAMFVFNFAVLGSDGITLHFSHEAGNSFSVGILFTILALPALLATVQKDT